MPKTVNPRRRYESPIRREQADLTRRAILDAARALFLERGYVATPIQAIARRARVSPATVYGIFGTKRAILAALVDISIAGDDAPVPIRERPWVRDLQQEPELRGRIRILARNGRLILERRAPIDAVVAAAAATDPEIAGLWVRIREQRHAGQRTLLQLVIGASGRLRPGLTVAAAADILYTLGSPESYRLLVEDRGWSGDRFERWYALSIERLLFAPA
jgi:TetR/AcrR family transcriptional regulator, regulator of autoinduction and epiphytic fitness